MKVNKLLVLALGLTSFFVGKTQTVMQFELAHGGLNNDVGSAMIPTADGNFIYTGTTESAGAGAEDIMLNKMTPEGVLIWEKTFGGSDVDRSRSIVELPDGNYVVFGDTKSFGSGNLDYYLLKVDSGGNLIWEKNVWSF